MSKKNVNWPKVIEGIERGDTMKVVAREQGINVTTLYRRIREASDEIRAQVDDAKRASAESLVQSALEILDAEEAGRDNASVNLAKARANQRIWMAGKRNPDYAEKQNTKVEVSVDMGATWLKLMREGRGNAENYRAVEGRDYELLPPGEGMPEPKVRKKGWDGE